tara:strand:- start:735 stop:947 length:213 start_codon:yes stop_codon:yes gene_type:complete
MTQYLINFVSKLDKINDIDFQLDGSLKNIIEDPIKWGEDQVQRAISENLDNYIESKELGKEFWDGIKNKS